MNHTPVDINGSPVSVGAKVKILKISESLLEKLPQDEVDELKTMVGEIFTVVSPFTIIDGQLFELIDAYR